MSEDDEVRDLFSAIVAGQPAHPGTTTRARLQGRRIRRRRRVTAAVGGAALAAVVALAVPPLLTGSTVATDPADPVASAPVAPTTATSTSNTTAGPTFATPDPERGSYCGTITGVDPESRTVTFRAFLSYTYGGESATVSYPETATIRWPVTAATTVTDLALRAAEGGQQVSGDLPTRLEFAQRNGSGDRRAYLVIEGADSIADIQVNKPVSGAKTEGCEDTRMPATTPDSYCGTVTATDATAGTITVRSVASYTDAGTSVTPAVTTITPAVTEDTLVADVTSGTRKDVGGNLATRLQFAATQGTGGNRVYVFVTEGVVTQINLAHATTGTSIDGCEDPR